MSLRNTPLFLAFCFVEFVLGAVAETLGADVVTPCPSKRAFWLHQVSPKGRGPGRRSEHSAAAVDGTMFVIGGRSTTAEYKDMFALDTEVDPPVWTEVRV